MNTAHRARPLSSLDLNLLLTFDAIWRERNLTRAAKQLFVSQSAVSHALARLREQVGDPLFVRRGAGVVPTAAAERIAPSLQEALRLVRQALEPREFTPAVDLGRVVVAMHDEFEPVILPTFVARVREAAPSVEVDCVRLERGTLEQDLGSGRLDLAIDVAQATGPELRHAPLTRDELCVVSRRRRRLSPQAYLRAEHVTVSSRRSGPSFEDALLRRLGHERSVLVRCQSYEAACRIVAESELLLTAPRLHAGTFAGRLKLSLSPLPFGLPPAELHLYWHRHRDTDARNVWLRARF